MDDLLAALKAIAEPTRLRILALCGHSEFTVSELVQILGQSQPRVSRHLKLLVDAKVLERHREGIWSYYRAAGSPPVAELASTVLDILPEADATLSLDLKRLESLKAEREARAQAYFKRNSERWDEVRQLYVNEHEVESALADIARAEPAEALLDIGTGTGRILELLGPQVDRAVGIDLSPDMLAVARTNLDRAQLPHCQVRKADMYQLPLPSDTFDLLTLHMVLHYAERPVQVLSEAARVLRPGGRVVIVDFAPHEEATLRTEHAHHWLGFSNEIISQWLQEAHLSAEAPMQLVGNPLTVKLWTARRPLPQELH
ncbi:MAG: metalloregulator ArsR/SmtB family transcription factor [Pseudomonadota bacterium]